MYSRSSRGLEEAFRAGLRCYLTPEHARSMQLPATMGGMDNSHCVHSNFAKSNKLPGYPVWGIFK